MKRDRNAVRARYLITPLRAGRRTVAIVAEGRIADDGGAGRCAVDHKEILVSGGRPAK